MTEDTLGPATDDALLGEVARIADRLTLTAAADESCLDLGHDLLEQLWVEHDEVPAEVRLRADTCVGEILANVVEHAFATSPDAPEELGADLVREVTLTVGVDAAGGVAVHAVVSDNGNPPSVDLSTLAMPDDESESGRGLAMTEAMASAFSVHRVAHHNVWRIRCDAV